MTTATQERMSKGADVLLASQDGTVLAGHVAGTRNGQVLVAVDGPVEGPAKEEMVAALVPVITSEHATAIVAQQIRETLSAPRPAPAQGIAPADHGTFSEICTGCGRYYDLSTQADQVMRVAVQQDGRVLVQCKDIEACYERWRSIVTYV